MDAFGLGVHVGDSERGSLTEPQAAVTQHQDQSPKTASGNRHAVQQFVRQVTLIGLGEARQVNSIGRVDRKMLRRLSNDLDGEIVCGRHVFHRATVIEYARARKEGRDG